MSPFPVLSCPRARSTPPAPSVSAVKLEMETAPLSVRQLGKLPDRGPALGPFSLSPSPPKRARSSPSPPKRRKHSFAVVVPPQPSLVLPAYTIIDRAPPLPPALPHAQGWQDPAWWSPFGPVLPATRSVLSSLPTFAPTTREARSTSPDSHLRRSSRTTTEPSLPFPSRPSLLPGTLSPSPSSPPVPPSRVDPGSSTPRAYWRALATPPAHVPLPYYPRPDSDGAETMIVGLGWQAHGVGGRGRKPRRVKWRERGVGRAAGQRGREWTGCDESGEQLAKWAWENWSIGCRIVNEPISRAPAPPPTIPSAAEDSDDESDGAGSDDDLEALLAESDLPLPLDIVRPASFHALSFPMLALHPSTISSPLSIDSGPRSPATPASSNSTSSDAAEPREDLAGPDTMQDAFWDFVVPA